MTNAFVLMTAMPPTTGHLDLIRFASKLHVTKTYVIVCTQPEEPYGQERYVSLCEATKHFQNVEIIHYSHKIEQNPEAPGFWELWIDVMKESGFRHGDYIVASETYGLILADKVGGSFIPYDLSRSLNEAKATNVRLNYRDNFGLIIPEMQRYLRRRVTIFGAESTGKTTLSKELAKYYNATWLLEWARPYLESTNVPINRETMQTIWDAQQSLQINADAISKDKFLIVQDTDLFSTLGYWDLPHRKEELGESPSPGPAELLKSDLYLLTSSNIPFEPDPQRYGIDRRESEDQYWIDILERFGLTYHVIQSDLPQDRLVEAISYIDPLLNDIQNELNFKREFN